MKRLLILLIAFSLPISSLPAEPIRKTSKIRPFADVKAETKAAKKKAQAEKKAAELKEAERIAAEKKQAEEEEARRIAAEEEAAKEEARREAEVKALLEKREAEKKEAERIAAEHAASALAKKNAEAFAQDMAYYQKVAGKKNVSANDRLYVLHRIKDKHATSNIDLTGLLQEIDKWEKAKRSAEPNKAPPAPTPAGPVPPPPPSPSPSTGPAVDPALVDPNYHLKSGDLLNIQVAPAKELSRETLIQPDGTVVLPLVGTLPVENMTITALERLLVQKYRLYVTKPDVSVTMRRFSMDSVFVMGKIARPGPVTYRAGMRLLGAVSEAGGFQDDADRTAVVVHRGDGTNQKTFTVDAQGVLTSGDMTKDFLLSPGDIIDVQRGGDNVSILGMVMRPGTFPHHDGISLLELLSEAGGVTQGALTKKVFVYRYQDAGRSSMRVNLARIMKGHPEDDVILQRGDIVMVPQKSLYAGTGAASTLMTPWLYLATLIITIIVVTKD